MKRSLWSLCKRLFRAEYLRDVDAALHRARKLRLIDSYALHSLDAALKYDSPQRPRTRADTFCASHDHAS